MFSKEIIRATFAQSMFEEKPKHTVTQQTYLAKHLQGQIRTQNMYVSTPDGKIEYVAALPYEVPGEMQKLYEDIAVLLSAQLSIEEVFYYAAFIHLVFVKIHPFNDGNGGREGCRKRSPKLGGKPGYQSEKTSNIKPSQLGLGLES